MMTDISHKDLCLKVQSGLLIKRTNKPKLVNLIKQQFSCLYKNFYRSHNINFEEVLSYIIIIIM